MSARTLIAVDLDGTLIDERLRISETDRTAIAESARAGNVICLASGRLFEASRPFAQDLGLSGPIIVLQGAVAYCIATGERLFCTVLAAETALRAYDDLKSRGFHLQLYYGDRLYLDTLNEAARYYLQLSRVEPVMVPDLRRLLTDAPPAEPGPVKLLAIADPELVLATIPALAQTLGSAASVFRSLPRFLEVTNPGANKGVALRQVARRLGFEMSATAAIGDSDNDIPMFEVAARSFAVANATPAAKRAAQEIVPALGSGVAFALQALDRPVASEA